MTTRFLAPALALAALAQGTAAHAQQACAAPRDIDDAMTYAMPLAFDATRAACSTTLARDGFLATEGERIAARFRQRQDAAWPGALRVLRLVVEQRGPDPAAGDIDFAQVIDTVPPETLRPLADALLRQMVAKEIGREDCRNIERGLELLSPLPVENIAGLMTFLVDIAETNEIRVCAGKPKAGQGK
ncbi:MAG: hypothetical protein V2I39_07060 [Erythrobacter sp.]|jgi:hypothetical protein|nr:hypothetical protein [Erythrobacter sp.]